MAGRVLKIGLVLDDSLDSTDGVQQYVLTLGAWLAAQGHEVHYLVGQTQRTDIPHVHSLARNLRVKFNGNRLSVPLPSSKRRLKAILDAERFDVLHVQTPYSPFMAGRLIRLAPASTAIVGTFHVLPYNRTVVLANKLLALLNHPSAKRFDAMIANSQPSKAFAQRAYGFKPVIIPNPFTLADFRVEVPTTDVPTIVFLGRLVARKCALQLLKAIDYMRQQKLFDGEYKVIIGGKGPLLSELQAYAHDNQLESVVSFPGFVAEADKPAFLATADIAVFPSVSGESFGISLLEAMAAARGVVLGGDNPGYRSVVAPLSENQLVKPDDAAAFAGQLASWLQNAEARQQAAIAQKEYVKQFDINHVGPQIVDVYTKALRQEPNVR